MNYLDVPAGMLSKQYFQPNLPGAINYAIGSVSNMRIVIMFSYSTQLIKVIGHEFTHGFDNQGLNYRLYTDCLRCEGK